MTSRSRKRFSEESMDIDDGSVLSDKHQLMLQYLMHARMVKKLDLSRVHGKLFNDSESLKDSLSTITSKINPLKMDIKTVNCDVTGETYFVLIHTTGESFYPKCCVFNQNQLEFLKKVLTGIVLSDNGMIGHIAALNSCETLSKSDGDETLRLFVKEKILMELQTGKLCLSPLAVVEFEPFFRVSLNDNLCSCDLCRQLVFFGKKCPSCNQKFHCHCVSKWLSSKRTTCPNTTCKTSWDDEMLSDTE